MVPSLRWTAESGQRFPRPRGDGPFTTDQATYNVTFPPPTRGWSLQHDREKRRRHVSPAHAGMVPPPASGRTIGGCFPRPRGDGPLTSADRTAIELFPPPTRGWSLSPPYHCSRDNVSPAHAGMVPRLDCTWHGRKCFPRPRGDGPAKNSLDSASPMFPPPTRGWSRRAGGASGRRNVSPAHAGMVPIISGYRDAAKRFPRPRGDGPCVALLLRFPA